LIEGDCDPFVLHHKGSEVLDIGQLSKICC